MKVAKKQIEGDTLLESAEDKVSVVQVREGLTLELDMEEGAMLGALMSMVTGSWDNPVKVFSMQLYFKMKDAGLESGEILKHQETILPTVVK